MEAIENLLTRRSIRKYKPDMIPEDILEKILTAGTYAATGMGRQSPIIIAVTDKNTRDRPVSYTHLDVYKRQPRQQSLW